MGQARLPLSPTLPDPRAKIPGARELPPCTVVVVPTHGFGNRMRMLSCAHAYAAHHGCVLQALWRTTLHMPTPWADLFATPLAQPDPSTVVRHGDRLYTVASLAASFARLSADDPDAWDGSEARDDRDCHGDRLVSREERDGCLSQLVYRLGDSDDLRTWAHSRCRARCRRLRCAAGRRRSTP